MDRLIAGWLEVRPDLDPLGEGIMTRVQVLVKHLHSRRERHLRTLEMSVESYRTLHAFVARGNVATRSELCADLAVSEATLNGRLCTLIGSGAVRERHRPPNRDDLELTAQGYDAWDRAFSAQAEEERALLRALSVEEQRQLDALLRRMIAIADQSDDMDGA